MNSGNWIYALATLSGAIGAWLLLPRGRVAGRGMGALLMAASLALFGACALRGASDEQTAARDTLTWLQFYLLAAITVVSAVAAISLRNPVYCAVWFGMSLLGVAGLMLWQGAQFLAVATIVVYAGAILVTLLFVLMLATPTGAAAYDRLSWEAPLSATVGMVIVGVLTIALQSTPSKPHDDKPPEAVQAALADNILHTEHTAHLGRELFSRHLIAIELAGTLLLVALVGAVAIVAHSRSVPPSSGAEVSANAGGARHG